VCVCVGGARRVVWFDDFLKFWMIRDCISLLLLFGFFVLVSSYCTRAHTGVILVSDSTDHGGFDSDEEALLKVFAQQAAVAITASQRIFRVTEADGIRPADTTATDYLVGA